MSTECVSFNTMCGVKEKDVKASTKFEFFKTPTSITMITTVLANAYREAEFQETMYQTLDYNEATQMDYLTEKKRKKIATVVRKALNLIFKTSADQKFHYTIVKQTMDALQQRTDVWMLFCSSILVFDISMAEDYPMDEQCKEFMDWLRIADGILKA